MNETLTRKGLHRYFHVSPWDTYLSLVAKIYYKLFEEQYDKKA